MCDRHVQDREVGSGRNKWKADNKIGRRAARAAVLALLHGGAAVNYFMDYLGG